MVFDELEKYPVIHQQALIISHRYNISNSGLENRAINRGWQLAVNELGGIPDIILAITLSGLITAAELLKNKKLDIPIILQEHSVPLSMHLKTEERKTRAIVALKQCEEIIVVANRQLEEFMPLIDSKSISIIPNPARQEFFDAPIYEFNKTGVFKIVTVGHLNNQKAQYRLILGIAVLLKKVAGIKVSVDIIGDGVEKTVLIDLVKKLGLVHLINFTGALNTQQIIDHLKSSDIFVLSSKYENCPVALIEAQAMGIPCLCTINNASEYVLLKNNGLAVIQDETGESIAEGINNIIDNIKKYSKKDIRMEALKHYSPKIFAEVFLKKIHPYITN